MNLDITEKWAKEIALMSDADFEENCKHIETLLKRRKQALRIHDVSGRSELLIAFGKFIDADCDLLGTGYIEEIVKKFEASNSH